jgi:plasmid maintenance system killer protein
VKPKSCSTTNLPGGCRRRFSAWRKLLVLHQARSLNDLRVPYGNHLEALKDDRKGRHSIRVNDQFSLIQTLIKKHKRPRKWKWLRLLQCVPFIYRTMKFICWLISNSDWNGR